MLDLIFDIFGSVDGETVVLIIFIGLGGLLVFGWLGRVARQAVPGLMTSLGIFGTFWGVFIALYPLDFSPNNINDSIEALLKGMTTAFSTSLLGLAFAIGTKAYWSSAASAKKSPSPEHEDIAGRLDAIRKAIAGDDNSSMLTQIQKLRDENSDGFKKLDGLAKTIQETLVKSIETLTTEIHEVVGKQLSTSLAKLIENIEKALIDQFGKTFVQFNEAVQALKKWQEDHRFQVEQLTKVFNETARGIEKIKEGCKEIPQTMEAVERIVQKIQKQMDELSKGVDTFATMKQKAEDSFPTIKANLDTIGEDLKNSAKGFSGLQGTITKVFENAEKEVKNHTENMRSAIDRSQQDAAAKMHTIITESGEAFAKRINEEVDRLTREWGNNMVSIAEKCATTIRRVDEDRRTQ